MIFRSAAKHGRATDVNVFNRIVEADIGFGDGLFEGVEVDDHQVNRLDIVFFDSGFVLGIATQIEQTAMHAGVQRFDASNQHFRETGMLADILNRQVVLAEGFGGATGGNNFHACLHQSLGEGD